MVNTHLIKFLLYLWRNQCNLGSNHYLVPKQKKLQALITRLRENQTHGNLQIYVYSFPTVNKGFCRFYQILSLWKECLCFAVVCNVQQLNSDLPQDGVTLLMNWKTCLSTLLLKLVHRVWS